MQSSKVSNELIERSSGSGISLLTLFLSISALLIMFIMGIALGLNDIAVAAIVIGFLGMVLLVILRQDELLAGLIITAHLYVDWYLVLLFTAQPLTLALLIVYFLFRSPQHPWKEPRALGLWVLFLVLAILPAVRGALTRYDAALYYPNIILGALLMFWLGTVITRNIASVQRFFMILALIGTLLAVITIVQAITGTLLFGTSRFDAEIAATNNFALFTGSNIFRPGSFFVNPDWNGTFFATMLFLPLGLFTESSSILGKVLYLAEGLLMLFALLLTYSTGAWVGASVGLVGFVLLVGAARYRILLSSLVSVIALVGVMYFPSQVGIQLQHALTPIEFSLRMGAWQTGINVISAFPLTGIGLGLQAYIQRAEPYRVPAQYLPLGHPHNSYIEIGAMAGLPVLITFIALLLFALWQALRNLGLADVGKRSLLSGGIAAVLALSANSVSINGWTFPPLAAIGWVVLGALSSPLLMESLRCERKEGETSVPTSKI